MEGETLREIVLRGILRELERPAEQPEDVPRKRFELPVIRSARPGSLKINNETIHDLIEFP
jgi:hypothetical protein